MKSISRYFFIKIVCLTAIIGIISAQEIKDIIQPLQITPGKQNPLLVSDLFYARSYDLQFSKNKNIAVSYNHKTNTITLNPKNNNFGATLLEFTLHGEKNYLPVILNSGSTSQQIHNFTFKPDRNVNDIFVSGSFNNWNKKSHRLNDKEGKGIYELGVPLDPGSYIYKFIVDGKEILDPTNPEKTP
ncbi:MAG TPA: hypothetical protein DCQ28_05985, partial [Bacteroidetes bacterium]|nr:hypothetical protein [Bacteroidota bacterium]